MDGGHIAAVAGGVVLLILTALTRSGVLGRIWGGVDMDERMVTVGFPGLGGVLLLAGLMPVLPETPRAFAAVAAVLLAFAVVIWCGLALPLPLRWVPKHLRAARAARIRHEKAQRARRKAARRG